MIFQPPELDSREREVLARIDEREAELRYLVGTTPRRWGGLLRRSALARSIRGSNSIEGYHINIDDALAAAEGGLPVDADPESWAAVMGYRMAMTCVLQLAADPGFRHSADWLKSLQFMMIQHDLTKHPGRWRPGAVFVRDAARGTVLYEGPEASALPALIHELLADLNAAPSSESHRIIRAAMAHLNLVMIHPFSDGNGRMARCLQTLVLARAGEAVPQFASIEEYLGDETPAYYGVLARTGGRSWNPAGDTRPWIRFCLTAHWWQALKLQERSREMQRLWDLLETDLQRAGLPERMLMALADAATGLRVRNATYRSVAEVSDQVASRDLKALVDAGWLEAKGERRGRYYTASRRLREIAAQTREPAEWIDPFADN